MINIRRNVFETNSSSVHSLILCTKKDYKAFQNGKLFYVNYSSLKESEKLCTWEQLLDIIKNKKIYVSDETYEDIVKLRENNQDETLEDYLADWDIFTFDAFMNRNEELEDFYNEITTESGETICAFGYYGEST